jgi:hypothetical protein
MAENMEKGMNFVNPPEKAEDMAYAEKTQREGEDKRRERAGLEVDKSKRDVLAKKAGEEWEKVQQYANEFMKDNVSRIEEFLTERGEDNKELHLEVYWNGEETKGAISEKIKAYLGEDFPDISLDYTPEKSGYNAKFVLKRQEIQEE